MQTIGDLVAAAREREGVLFEAADGADHGYEAFLTTVWKAGNLLRHYGVRPGDSVAVAIGPAEPTEADELGRLGASPTPLLAVLGAMAAGARVNVDPVAAVEATVLVAPTAWLDRFTPGPGTKPMGYGDEVDEPTVAQFEREAWSENPVAPPVDLDPTTTALGGTDPRTNGDLLAQVRRLSAEYGVGGGERVGLDAPIDAGGLVAGVLLPMAAGATVVLSPAAGDGDLDLVVGAESSPGAARRIDPDAVFGGR